MVFLEQERSENISFHPSALLPLVSIKSQRPQVNKSAFYVCACVYVLEAVENQFCVSSFPGSDRELAKHTEHARACRQLVRAATRVRWHKGQPGPFAQCDTYSVTLNQSEVAARGSTIGLRSCTLSGGGQISRVTAPSPTPHASLAKPCDYRMVS